MYNCFAIGLNNFWPNKEFHLQVFFLFFFFNTAVTFAWFEEWIHFLTSLFTLTHTRQKTEQYFYRDSPFLEEAICDTA